jgi:hypothetical protein
MPGVPRREMVPRQREGANMNSRINIVQHSSVGTLWFAGWLFTIGYLNLGFWWSVLGLIVWPYFIGAHFAPALP